MEDLESKETADWVAAQNRVTDPYLAKLPLRDKLKARLTALWNYPRVGMPQIRAGQLLYAKNTGLQRQPPLFLRAGLAGAPALVIDPNSCRPSGSISLAQ